MQLPRGTFCAIQKGVGIAGLILELEQSRFTGICSLSLRVGTAHVVFSSGSCILAELPGKTGDAAGEGIVALGCETADAALSTLDATQVRLALDFNKGCRTTTMMCLFAPKGGACAPGSDPLRAPAPRALDESLYESPATDLQPPTRAEMAQEPGTGFEDDFDTLDHMDLDAVSDKIRKDCKTLIQQLDLEHLIHR